LPQGFENYSMEKHLLGFWIADELFVHCKVGGSKLDGERNSKCSVYNDKIKKPIICAIWPLLENLTLTWSMAQGTWARHIPLETDNGNS